MKTAKQILTEARDLILDPNRWTTGAFARDELGTIVSPVSKYACKWCASGAVYKVSNNEPLDALYNLVRFTNGRGVASINDLYGHSEVMEMFNKAIESCP